MKPTPPAHLEILEARIAPASITTLTWQGDLATAGWDDGTVNTNTNWLSNLSQQKIPVDGNILAFPAGAPNKTNVNDIAGLDLRSISIRDSGYSINGNPITLSAGLSGTFASGSSAFTPAITLAADQTFSNAAGNLNLGAVDLGGHTLTIDTAGSIIFSANASSLTGAGSLVKTGTGAAILNSTASFTGPVQVNEGLLRSSNDSTLGAAGPGNGTTVASGAAVELFSGTTASTFAEDFTLSGNGVPGKVGALVVDFLGILNNATVKLSGALRLGGDAAVTFDAGSGTTTLAFTGAVGATDDALAVLSVIAPPVNATVAFANTTIFTTELAGTTPGATGHDQLKVFGPVNLGDATLNVVPSFTPAVGAKFVIVDNDGADAITGTFAGLAEGAAFSAGGVNFTISYKGPDGATGNDAVLTVAGFSVAPGTVTLSGGGKIATFTDVDGDLVTVKTTKGPFQTTDFQLAVAGVGAQLQQLNLTTHPADFAGAGITVTAKPGPLGGNGFVNVGYLNATGIDLGVVKIGGDLGRINAGTAGGDAKVPGIKSLTVESLGLLGTSTQASGGNIESKIEGAVPKLAVKGDVRASFSLRGTDGGLGNATIGGTITDGSSSTGDLTISASGGIASLSVGGDIRSGANEVFILSSTTIGTITVGGAIVGTGARSVAIFAFGQAAAPTGGLDLALKSLSVKGSVESFGIEAGTLLNADASIGSITVGGDWIGSSVQAGVSAGADAKTGTADDTKAGAFFPPRDNPAIFSTIGSFTVKGQALGTAGTTTDMFGVVAERIGKANVGTRTFAFTGGTTPEAFFAAPTLDGEGTENPTFDFTIRELGSTTPTVAFPGVSLTLSANAKTATFIDVDGDLVTVKRTAGTFTLSDFDFIGAVTGSGQLTKLTLAAAPGDLSITAVPGPDGGNGFVNIGQILATGVAVGKVSIAGDLGNFSNNGGGGDRFVASLSAHSHGLLGTSTGAGVLNLTFDSGGVGKIAFKTNFRGGLLSTVSGADSSIGSVTIGGTLGDPAGTTTKINADDRIGAIKIGGSVLAGTSFRATQTIGTISIGGDFVGNVNQSVDILAFGAETAPTKGLDLAIKSLTVKGSVESVVIEAGGASNADAAIGTISVGRAWIASSVNAGAVKGGDTFLGTADDAKLTGAGVRDNAAIFSTIASIAIKGQALGSTASGDSFGIVAEVIGKAKIGARTFVFDKGERDAADAFAAAPTGPGPAPDNAASDFFIREITQ